MSRSDPTDQSGDSNGNLPTGVEEDVVTKIQEALRRLDDEYTKDLLPKEQALKRTLDRVKDDERRLLQVIEDATGATDTSRHRLQQQQRSEEAAARLLEALMNDSSATSSSDEEE
jgi:C4-type Zn-finger protein